MCYNKRQLFKGDFMEMNIFAVKDDVVQTYYVTMNEKLVKNTQAKIDEWNGKGELKETKSASLMGHMEYGKKIEVVSKKYAGQGEIFYYCCPAVETTDMYNYKFYKYTPHALSKLCDTLLKDYESLDFSKHLAQLLSWSSDNQEEMSFVNELISAFKFKKFSVEEVVQSDLTIDEKRNILRRIVDAIKNVSKPTKVIASPKTYEEEVERKIESMEAINTGFYSRELNGEDFKYTPKQRVAVKRKILESLPTVTLIEKK